MSGDGSFDEGKAQSLVFTFAGELSKDEDYGAPEPDFLKWLDKSLFVDAAIAGDSAADKELSESEREAWQLYCNALEATNNLLDIYKSDPSVFQKIAEQMMFLPSFLALHPDNSLFNRRLLKSSRLGIKGMANNGSNANAHHLARQSWSVKYAYAITTAIGLTMDTYEEQLPIWAEIYGYGVKHPIPMSQYEETARKMGFNYERLRLELPSYVGSYKILPAWTKNLETLRRPFNSAHVLDYWRTGKAMILEEMPDFHLRPEWENYRRRRYKTGSKKGAVQHAIFKDILAALRTIAGSKHRRVDSKTVTK